MCRESAASASARAGQATFADAATMDANLACRCPPFGIIFERNPSLPPKHLAAGL
jgi:hypothetical protein